MDSLRIEPVDGLVEHHRLRVAEQRRCDAEALAHAERELAGTLASHVVQADEVDELVTRRFGIPCVCASASRWLYAERPVWTERASRSAPTSYSGDGWSR